MSNLSVLPACCTRGAITGNSSNHDSFRCCKQTVLVLTSAGYQSVPGKMKILSQKHQKLQALALFTRVLCHSILLMSSIEFAEFRALVDQCILVSKIQDTN